MREHQDRGAFHYACGVGMCPSWCLCGCRLGCGSVLGSSRLSSSSPAATEGLWVGPKGKGHLPGLPWG
eukprot:scaffold58801_cov33-Tisochrysis_lutea.AAC.1